MQELPHLPSEHEELNVLMLRRREELEALKKLGVNPYPYDFPRDHFSLQVIQEFRDDEPQKIVSVDWIQIIHVANDDCLTCKKRFHNQRHFGHDGLYYVGRKARLVIAVGNKAILAIGRYFAERDPIQIKRFGNAP